MVQIDFWSNKKDKGIIPKWYWITVLVTSIFLLISFFLAKGYIFTYIFAKTIQVPTALNLFLTILKKITIVVSFCFPLFIILTTIYYIIKKRCYDSLNLIIAYILSFVLRKYGVSRIMSIMVLPMFYVRNIIYVLYLLYFIGHSSYYIWKGVGNKK